MGLEHFEDNSLINFFITALYLTIPIQTSYLQIFNLKELETLDTVKWLVKEGYDDVSIWKVTVFRVVVTLLMILPIFFIKDEFFLYLISGSLIALFLGFFMPVI